MRNWELLARAQRAADEPRTDKPARGVFDFVSISREIGSGGFEVAATLGERLGWPVFDKQILQAMAGDDKVRARLYEAMDERDETWLESVMRWLMQGELRRDDYFHRLSETVLALARQSHAVFLGRGTDLILPREAGLRVRIVAPEKQRVQTLARRNGWDAKAAAAELERIGAERTDFIRNHFGKDEADPLRFDLTLNTGRMTPAQAVELIVYVLRRRGVIA